MAKICVIEKKQVVVLKKEIYVEGTKEEVQEWLKHHHCNDANYKWRECIEYVQPDSETLEVLELPDGDDFNFLRFIQKPEVYNLERDNNRQVSSKPRSA